MKIAKTTKKTLKQLLSEAPAERGPGYYWVRWTDPSLGRGSEPFVARHDELHEGKWVWQIVGSDADYDDAEIGPPPRS